MSNRSGSPYSLPRDSNRISAAGAVKSSDGITVQPLEVDSSGNLLVNVAAGGGSGGTASTFGAAFPGTGTAAGASDGTNMKPLLVDTNGFLKVNVEAGSGSGLSVTDAATWTTAVSNFVPSGGVFNDTATALSTGTQGTQRLTANRAGHVNIRNQAGTELATSSNPLQVSLANTAANATAVKVDGSAVTQPVSAASLPLPTGAATSAKQPALGTAGTASSDVITVQGITSMTPIQVSQATAANLNATVIGTGTFAVQATLNAETTKVIGVTRTADGSGNLLTSTTNALDVNLKSGAIAAGSAAIGTVNLSPTASGGWTPYFANAVTTTATVSGSAGKFGGYMLINLNTAPAYLQVFDTTGAVTLGTTPPTFVIPIPANATATNGIAANVELANGIVIANGIKVAATTTANGASTVSTGLSGSIWYK